MRGLVAFSKLAEGLIAKSLPEALRIATAKSAQMAGCPRCCIILPVKKNGLVLQAGYPEGGHGVGQEVTGEHADFLRKIIHVHRRVVLINNPAQDPRTPHLKDHAVRNSITSIAFVPLLSHEEPLGVMVFDFTAEIKKPAETVEIVKMISELVACAMERSLEDAEEEKRALQRERLLLLGERYARVAHVARNALMIIGGLANRLHHDHSLAGKNREYAALIFDEVRGLERVMKNVLNYSRFSPTQFELGDYGINGFLRHFIERTRLSFQEETPPLHQPLRLHFYQHNHDITACFDKRMLETCLQDIVKNAKEAGAKNVWICTKIKPKKKRILISIGNDGETIDKEDLKGIFDPFFTTKTGGTGLGLAITHEIIEGHGGCITAESFIKKKRVHIQKNTKEPGSQTVNKNPRKKKKRRKRRSTNRTIFRIYLPL